MSLMVVLYRYTARSLDAAGNPDLDDGFLEVAKSLSGRIGESAGIPWPDPLATTYNA